MSAKVDLKLELQASQDVHTLRGLKRIKYDAHPLPVCPCGAAGEDYHALGCPAEICPVCARIEYFCQCDHE